MDIVVKNNMCKITLLGIFCIFAVWKNVFIKNIKEMKKVVVILVAAVLALTSCSTNSYSGKYTGTFKFISSNVTKEGSVRFTTNPLTSGLMLYGVVPIDPVSGSSSSYVSSDDNSALVTSLLQSIGNQNNIYNAATEQIKNVKIKANFNGNQVELFMYYEVTILELMTTEIRIVEFYGTK